MSADLANDRFEAALDECLARMKGGDSLEVCLSDFPALAGELQPLLALAAALGAAPPPRARPTAVAAGKQKVLAAFAAQETPTVVVSNRARGLAARLATILRPRPAQAAGLLLRAALGLIIAVAIGTTGAVAASSNSLPGDALYPVKESMQSLRLALAPDAKARQVLEAQFDSQRLLEIQSLVQMRRQAATRFEDVLWATDDNGWWTIGPFAVQVTDSTVVEGEPAAGDRVRAQVHIRDDGTLVASRVSKQPAGEHGREHHSGAEGPQFTSPLPTGAAQGPEHGPEHGGAHRDERHDGTGEAVSTAPLRQGQLATATPLRTPTVEPAHSRKATDASDSATPTAVTAHHGKATSEPTHHVAPTAAPPQPAPTTASTHHVAPTAAPPQPAPTTASTHHVEPTAQHGSDEGNHHPGNGH